MSHTTTTTPLPFDATLSTLKQHISPHLLAAKIGIVCGSGLSTLASTLQEAEYIGYDKLEGFGRSTVDGHKSTLAFGLLGEERVPVVVMLGRFHPYEGHPLSTVVYPIRVMARLGVKDIIITNAAGSLNPHIPVGTIVVIRDHIALPNLCGPLNPLLGPPTPSHPSSSRTYPRFLPLSNAHSPTLRRLVFLASHALSPPLPLSALEEGTYAWVSGPTYETAAEGRFLRAAGADVVGMSTVPEVVAAREEGMEVVVLSLVTNRVVVGEKGRERSVKEEVLAELAGLKADYEPEPTVSHAEVLAIGKEKADVMRQLVSKVVDLSVKQQR